MSSSQIIIITGHLGNDPILRYTTEGLAVVNFTVAVNMGKDKEPIWHNVSAWNQQAENCATYLKKGRWYKSQALYAPAHSRPNRIKWAQA